MLDESTDPTCHTEAPSTGWIALALYRLGWRSLTSLNNFHCQLPRRFQANWSHWQDVLYLFIYLLFARNHQC